MKRFALLLGMITTPALADAAGGAGHGHGMDWGYGYGMGMMFGPVLWIIVLGLVVGGLVWMLRRPVQGGGPGQPATGAIAELDLRLARGEIDAEDYAARKNLLTA